MLNDTNWYALWTHSNCEQLVHDQLEAKGFHVFLPRLSAWRRRSGDRGLVPTPMFPGYLFLRHAIDKTSYVEIVKARGLVRILGSRWDRLTVVPEAEIEAVRRMAGAGMPALPYPYLRDGQKMRITKGPLADLEGFFVAGDARRGLLVLSVDLLQRSVAVEIDCTLVAAA